MIVRCAYLEGRVEAANLARFDDFIAREIVPVMKRFPGVRSVRVMRALSVEDDGRGLPDDGGATAPAGGQGLSSMQARAQAIGAELNVGPGAHGGTLVRLALPAGGAVGAPP